MKNIKEFAKLFEIICVKFDGAPIGKKVVQKLFYFFERKGIQLNLRYGIHFYGPYSSKLDNMMHILESEDYISINTEGHTHIVSIGKVAEDCPSLLDHEKDYAELMEKLELAEAEQGEVTLKDFSKIEAILHSGWEEIYSSLDDEHKRAFWRSFIKSIEIDWTTEKKEVLKVNFF